MIYDIISGIIVAVFLLSIFGPILLLGKLL